MANPFRLEPQPLRQSPPPAAGLTADDGFPPHIASLKTKRVTIRSPPSSPPQDFFYPSAESSVVVSPAQPQDEYHGSPTINHPAGSSEPEDGPSDPFELEQYHSGEEDVEVQKALPPAPPSGPPLNPFAKTLKSLEDPHNYTSEDYRRGDQMPIKPTTNKPGSRATMDVDAFKQLLMTGKAPPPGVVSAPPTRSQFGLHGDSSSSTDTSSISRQSLFETLQEPHTETPRTSYERSASEDDDQMTLTGEVKKASKPKPPPPRPRHGKPVPPIPPKDTKEQRQPQVVSFDDFKPSFEPTGFRSPTNINVQQVPLNMNKPLPSPPPAALADESPKVRPQISPQRSTTSLEETMGTPAIQAAKRTPPPPPLSRRHSHMQRNNSSLSARPMSIASAVSIPEGERQPSPVQAAAAEIPVSKSAPPPVPPPRRSGTISSGTSTPQISTPSNEPASTTINRTPSLKMAPTPPQRNRSLSQASHSSAKQALSGLASPPLPPPRRRGSKSSRDGSRQAANSPRGSVEISRTSGEYDRRFSTSSLRQEDMISEFDEHEHAVAVQTPEISAPQLPPEPVAITDHHEEPASAVEEPASVVEDRVSVVEAPTLRLEAPALPVEEPAPAIEISKTSSVDILADMDAFQREIDALRDKYSQADAGVATATE